LGTPSILRSPKGFLKLSHIHGFQRWRERLRLPARVATKAMASWQFDRRPVNDFVRWIDDWIGDGCSPRNEIPEISAWLRLGARRFQEEAVWGVFLYTCAGGLSGAKVLREACGSWRMVHCVDHRKYCGQEDTLAAIRSYVSLMKHRGGQVRFLAASRAAADPFHELFQELQNVPSFGRLAAWDYLTRVNGTRALPFKIEPRRLYLRGSTGPLRAFQRLCRIPGNGDVEDGGLELYALVRARTRNIRNLVDLEDALCIWQKRRDDC